MKKRSGKNIMVVVLLFIFIVLIALIVLGASRFLVNDDNKNEKIKNSMEEETNNDNDMIKITLPSNEMITVNSEYEDVFNDNKKIIVTDYEDLVLENGDANSSELTLSELIKRESDKYDEEVWPDKSVLISNTLFDLDDDGIKEIMFSLGEEFILLHYYDNKVYGYILGGYRANGNWRVDGTSMFSSSATDNGINKYSFDKDKLVKEIIASAEGDYSEISSTNINIVYRVKGEIVSEEEYNNFLEEQENISLIEYIDYL